MNKIIKFAKDWTLLVALVVGSVVYVLFTEIDLLVPVGEVVGPWLVKLLPVNIFVMLYLTFCKMDLSGVRPRRWHFELQAIRTLLSFLAVVAVWCAPNEGMRLLMQGVFICVICPTASASPVIVEKLGGSIGSLTMYLLIANVVTAIIIPSFFPLVERGADISFMESFAMVLKSVVTVLVLPLLCALASRRWLKGWVSHIKTYKNVSFYLWAFNLSVLMGLTIGRISSAPVSTFMLAILIIIPLVVSVLQFSIGKLVGYRYDASIEAGQALGQKNTIVGIWLTISYLNPYAVISPCCYVVWQNMINAVQLHIKQKHGYLKW